jgi:hypothetical protein
MSAEYPPEKGAKDQLGDGTGSSDDPGYWHALIKEEAAAEFLGVTRRSLQKWRQVGGGPRYVSLSARCLRYRRIDLTIWSDGHLRRSTSDLGAGTEVA